MSAPKGQARFTFRPLSEADLPMLFEWLGRPHLLEWWRPEATVEELRAKYLPRVAGADAARPFVASEGERALGYIQYYVVADGDPNWWPDTPGPGVLGIDQFLADPGDLEHGIGAAMITAFLRTLFEDQAVVEVRVDPRPDNARAIRCYERVGFRSRGRVTTPDGPALWMVLRRESFPDIELNREAIDSPVAARLIRALNEELLERYPEDGTEMHFRLDPDEVAPGNGVFLVAFRNGEAIACGAVRRIESDIAEIKRMYVLPRARRSGVGRRLLEALEHEARGLGAKRVLLETGPRQPEAIELYERAGYAETGAFGEYETHPLSSFFEKRL